MRLLLDTHIFIWYIVGDTRLPERWSALLRDPTNDVFLSVVSVWEASIKYHLGKLPLPEPPEIYLPRQRLRHLIETLPLEEPALRQLTTLPIHHRDPFDCILICQALEHRMIFVTADKVIHSYPVEILSV